MTTQKNQIDETQAEKLASINNLNQAIIDEIPVYGQSETDAGQAEAAAEGVENGLIASMVVNGAAELTRQFYPFLTYDENVRAQAIAKITPLLEKYNISMPLLDKWKVELEAGIFFGGVIFGSYVQVQQYKKEQAEKTVSDAPTESEVKT